MSAKRIFIEIIVFLALMSTTGVTKCAQLDGLGPENSDSLSATTISNELTQSSDSSVFLLDFASASGPPSENDQWCKMENGTSFAQGSSFMDGRCSVCQCLSNRSITCKKVYCMVTYCIDGSKPQIREGQCCPQCSYEKVSETCEYKNLTLKHGMVIKRTAENVYCWCQSGSIECADRLLRRVPTSSKSSEPSPIIIAGLSIGGTLIVSVLLTVLFKYCTSLISKNNTSLQRKIAEEVNNRGWREISDENGIDTSGSQPSPMNNFELYSIFAPRQVSVYDVAL